MKFTIVTPSYNQGQYIRETIESTLSQRGDFSIEYIVCDGGSTDQTVDILKEFEATVKAGEYPLHCNDVSFSWVSEKDGGEANATNKGFAKATGDILAYQNSDDFFEPGAFEKVARAFKENPDVDMVYGDMYVLNEANSLKSLRTTKQMNVGELTTTNTRVFKPSAFFTKRIFEKVGRLDESLHFTADYDLWIRIFRTGTALYLSEPLSTWRMWGASKTGSQGTRITSEIDVVHKKYGLTMLNARRIQRMTEKGFFASVRKYLPTVYGMCKKAYYASIKRITYRV